MQTVVTSEFVEPTEKRKRDRSGWVQARIVLSCGHELYVTRERRHELPIKGQAYACQKCAS